MSLPPDGPTAGTSAAFLPIACDLLEHKSTLLIQTMIFNVAELTVELMPSERALEMENLSGNWLSALYLVCQCDIV